MNAVLARVEEVRRERIRAVVDHPVIRIGDLVIARQNLPWQLRARIVERVFARRICPGCDRPRDDAGVFHHRINCRHSDRALLFLCRKFGIPATVVERH